MADVKDKRRKAKETSCCILCVTLILLGDQYSAVEAIKSRRGCMDVLVTVYGDICSTVKVYEDEFVKGACAMYKQQYTIESHK